MRYIAIIVLALIVTGCIVKEAVQYDGEWVVLVDICFEMRLKNGEYEKRYIYIYEPVEKPGITKNLTYPLDNSRVIGSKHLIPIQR